jgi:hypothetical protein
MRLSHLLLILLIILWRILLIRHLSILSIWLIHWIASIIRWHLLLMIHWLTHWAILAHLVHLSLTVFYLIVAHHVPLILVSHRHLLLVLHILHVLIVLCLLLISIEASISPWAFVIRIFDNLLCQKFHHAGVCLLHLLHNKLEVLLLLLWLQILKAILLSKLFVLQLRSKSRKILLIEVILNLISSLIMRFVWFDQ